MWSLRSDGRAHDAHNVVVVVVVDDDAMVRVVERLRDIDGGIVVADETRVIAELPLPIAGLLSDRPLEDVLAASRAVDEAVRELGVRCPVALQTLFFLALSVVPSLKITDRGLVDVERSTLVALEVSRANVPAPRRAAAVTSWPRVSDERDSGNGRAARGRGWPGDLAFFLSRIGRTRLLAPAKEIALAKRVERGDEDERRRMERRLALWRETPSGSRVSWGDRRRGAS